MRTPLIYECHITVEPVFDDRALSFTHLCGTEKFKPAKLLMQNGAASRKDSFCTAHADTYEELAERMFRLVALFAKEGFVVYRYKIEAVLFDCRVV